MNPREGGRIARARRSGNGFAMIVPEHGTSPSPFLLDRGDETRGECTRRKVTIYLVKVSIT